MKRQLLLVLILGISTTEAMFAQASAGWNCETIAPASDLLRDELHIQDYSTFNVTNRIVKIYFHIIRRSNGTGGLTTAQVNSALNILRNDFADAQICFAEQGRSFINNDYYYLDFDSNPITKFQQLVQINRQSEAINIYLLPQNGWPGTGRSDGVPGNALVIDGSMALTSVISHEAGHCLGLYHTHHGTVQEGGDPNQCAELVNGSNASVCGDYVTDTPADPRIWSGCQYIGTVTDANGQPYNPDTDNILSYVSPACMNVFTPDQIDRMHAMIASSTIIENTLVQIDGPDRIPCMGNATYSIPSMPGVTYTWSVQSPLQIVSGQGTNAISVSSTMPAFATRQVSLAINSCSNVPVTKAVDAGVPEAAQNIDIFDPVTPPSQLCPNRIYRIEASGYDQSYDEFYWVLPQGWSSPDVGNGSNTFTTSGSSAFMVRIRTGSQPTSGSISVRAINDCGLGDPRTRGVSTLNCQFLNKFSVYPNPADQNLTVTLSEDFLEIAQNNNANNIVIKLFGIDQTLLETITMPPKGRAIFNTIDLPTGMYFLHIDDGNKIYKDQVVIAH